MANAAGSAARQHHGSSRRVKQQVCCGMAGWSALVKKVRAQAASRARSAAAEAVSERTLTDRRPLRQHVRQPEQQLG